MVEENKTCESCNYDLETWRYIGNHVDYPCNNCSRNPEFPDRWTPFMLINVEP